MEMGKWNVQTIGTWNMAGEMNHQKAGRVQACRFIKSQCGWNLLIDGKCSI